MQDTVENVMQGDAEHVAGEQFRVDPTFDQGFSEEADIQSFLSRPVKIHEQVWAVNNDIHVEIQPWELFLNNPAVSKKLDNYHLLRGELKVTFMINGTPQHAGSVMVTYNYLDSTNTVSGVGVPFDYHRMVTRSQRPITFLNPTTCKGSCMCLPFFWKNNYLDLQTGNYGLGSINMDSFQPLRLLGGIIEDVNITVFAHMTNVTLTVPTLHTFTAASETTRKGKKATMKKNDEYGKDGPVSGPASAVAAIAADLTQAPIIGPFALATQIGAESIAGIASVFGYSKPSEVRDGSFMRNTPNYSMATGDGSDLVQKLSLTRKQELTIDPVTVGLSDLEDTMSISKIAMRESYLTQFNWDPTSQAVDQWLFTANVTPTQYLAGTTGSLVDYIVPTACCYASRPFKYWSGTMKFRFKIVASAFSRGRLAIVYDPYVINNSTLDTYNTNFVAIVDISETKDFTIEIPWMQAEPYKPTEDVANLTAPNGTAVATPSSNGILGVRILNELAQPDATTIVSVNVFVSAGEDFEVANLLGVLPNEGFTAASATVTDNSQEDAPEEGDTTITLGSPSAAIDHKALVFFGERVSSFREVVKRYSFHRALLCGTSSNDTTALRHKMSSFPAYRSSTSVVASNMLQYLCSAHAAWRGSIRYKINTPAGDIEQIMVDRQYGDITTAYQQLPSQAITGTADDMTAKYLTTFNTSSSGLILTTTTMPTLEYEIPYVSPIRYSKTVQNNNVSNYQMGNASLASFVVRPLTDGFASVHVAAGEDFQVFGFVGAPVLYDIV